MGTALPPPPQTLRSYRRREAQQRSVAACAGETCSQPCGGMLSHVLACVAVRGDVRKMRQRTRKGAAIWSVRKRMARRVAVAHMAACEVFPRWVRHGVRRGVRKAQALGASARRKR